VLGDTYGRLGWDLNNPAFRLGPKFAYVSSGYRFYYPEGGSCGRSMSDVANSMKMDGVALDQHAPYDCLYNRNWNREAKRDSSLLKLDSFAQVQSYWDEGRRTIKGLLFNARRPVAICMGIDQGFMGYHAGSIYNYVGPTIVRHALCIVGYDDSLQAYKVRNSWGPNWGNGGYLWISYDTFDSQANPECFAIDDSYNPQLVSQFFPSGERLTPPQGLAASDGSSPLQIELTWRPVSGATGYKVYRDTRHNQIGYVENAETYIDTSGDPNYSYIYWVCASDGAVASQLSNSDMGYLASPE
jgi:hypothetical protein